MTVYDFRTQIDSIAASCGLIVTKFSIKNVGTKQFLMVKVAGRSDLFTPIVANFTTIADTKYESALAMFRNWAEHIATHGERITA
jgi:hypothetical protein